MNEQEARVGAGAFIGLFICIGIIVFGFQFFPAFMMEILVPAVTLGLLVGSSAIGGWVAYSAFKAKAKNFRR
ncbi:MAG: hypothetical protein DDT25_00026 [Chloroflexi bacterium]|nr:hypothetical protein [Chloroflexota bacterium]